MGKYALILAAGEGKRMKSATSKVLHKVCGKEMVNHVIDIMRKAGFDDVNVIVGKGKDPVREKTASRDVSQGFPGRKRGNRGDLYRGCSADP